MGIKKLLALLGSATLGLGLAGVAAAPSANAAVFNAANATSITFTGTGPVNADQYPSVISQFGMSTTITDVNVTLTNITHSFKGDLDVMLISPQGTALVLTSDNCNINDPTTRTYTFDDAAAAPLNPGGVACATGTYQPSNGSGGAGDEVFPTVATATTLAGFNGQNPNGSWQLFVRDDQAVDTGAITGGWSLQISTAAAAPITFPALGSNGGGVAAPYPVPIAVNGLTGPVTDVNVTLPGLAHTFPDDLDMLLVSPSGTKVVLMSDACGSTDVLGVNLTFDDQAATAIPDATACASGSFRPADYEAGDVYPAPAPAGPYGTTLAAFNGQSGNGTWNLYVNDDAGADGGWLAANPTLAFKTSDVTAPDTTITKKPHTGFQTSATIKFSSTEAGSTFECKVDKKAYKPCSSPYKLKHLKIGKHKIFVRATDASGNVDKTPAKAKWTVLRKNH